MQTIDKIKSGVSLFVISPHNRLTVGDMMGMFNIVDRSIQLALFQPPSCHLTTHFGSILFI